MTHDHSTPAASGALTRRRFLALAGGTAGALTLARPAAALTRRSITFPSMHTANTRIVELTPARTTVDLAGRHVRTLAYNDALPGPLIRVRAGDTIRARLTNRLREETTVHWHGIASTNPMDGVPGVTQPAIAPGMSFDYEFVAPDPGTYFFHPHVGLQLDHGLYAALIVEDPNESGAYDKEWVIVLDDWTDGIGPSPERIFARLRGGSGMSNDSSERTGGHAAMGSGMATNRRGRSKAARGENPMMSQALGGMAGDVDYPLYLINGRPPKDPETFRAKPGQRIRLRIINAGSDTAFRFAVGGHRLTVTHADGFPVQPLEADAVLIGMGERVDAVVTCRGDVNAVVARAEGKRGSARAVLRAGSGSVDRWTIPQLDRRLVTVADLAPTAAAALPARVADRTHRLKLGGSEMRYRWTIDDQVYDSMSAYPVASGERVRIEFVNRTKMWHPMHLHGHTFAVMRRGVPGVRKDTVVVKPDETVPVEFDADNPGAWVIHCHNAYHLEAGMMTTLRYQ